MEEEEEEEERSDESSERSEYRPLSVDSSDDHGSRPDAPSAAWSNSGCSMLGHMRIACCSR